MTTTINNRIDTLNQKLDTLSQQMATLTGQIMSRAEIDNEVNTRVSKERFESEMSGLHDRLGRLESGPQKMLGWVGAGIGCLSAVFTGVGVTAAIVIALLPHLR